MRRHTSKFLKAVSIAYMSFPVSYLIVAAILFDISASRSVSLLLEPFFYLICFLCVVAGWGLWEMKRWSWNVFLAANLLIVYESAYLVANFGETHHKFLSFMMFVSILAGLIYRVRREVKVPYFLPAIRWWESHTEYQLTVPAKIHLVGNKKTFEGDILDLSLRGCFIRTGAWFDDDAEVVVEFKIFGQALRCEGIVVWNAESAVTHPRGAGIRFDSFPRPLRRRLRIAIKRLSRVAAFHRRPKGAQDQDVVKVLNELESSSRISQ